MSRSMLSLLNCLQTSQEQRADLGDYFEVEDTEDGEINVMIDTGKIIPFKVKGSDTINALKLKIQVAEDIPLNAQELIFDEKVLDNIKTFSYLHIKKQSTLRLSRKMEIFVITLKKKTISLWVKPTYTIAYVKWLILQRERIPIGQQVLIFNQMVLGDKGTLFDFQINPKSTITLMHKPERLPSFMRISIKIPTGETIALKVKPSNTIKDVKVEINDVTKVPCDEQELIFNEIVLSNFKTLAEFNVIKDSTLTLLRISSGFMKIFIKPTNGSAFALDVKPYDTVLTVKYRIHEKRGSQPRHQDLIFEGNRLEDGVTLSDYHILMESTVNLVVTRMIG